MKVIILCGGSGSRLWPLSRTQYPKQFLKLAGMELSIFQLTVKRALRICDVSGIYFVTSEIYRHLIVGQMEELGILPMLDNILCEPAPKNTLPAITYAVKQLQSDDTVVVFSSDHQIENEELLINTIESAQELVSENIVTFGIKAVSPETVYGYIKPSCALSVGYKVESFIEKPDKASAEKYVKEGYFWNSGMFIFNVGLFMELLKEYNPLVYDAFLCVRTEDCYDKTPSISIDYGLLEKISCNAVIPMDVGWSDLGNFIAFYDKYHADLEGNVSFHDEIIMDGTRNLVYSEGEKAIALVGLSDTVIIDQQDALLVCDRRATHKVKDIVDALKERGDKRADVHITEYRHGVHLPSLRSATGTK